MLAITNDTLTRTNHLPAVRVRWAIDPDPISLEMMNSSIMPPACRLRQRVRSSGSRQSRGHSAHIGAEVVVHYRWHPLHGRSLRRQYSERRADGGGVHVEAAPRIVIVVPRLMLDPAACAGLGFGAPRVAVAALVDLHDLLNILGFLRGSTTDVVQETRHEAVPTPIDPSPAPAEPAACPDQAGAAEPRRAARRRRAPRCAPARGSRPGKAGGDQ